MKLNSPFDTAGLGLKASSRTVYSKGLRNTLILVSLSVLLAACGDRNAVVNEPASQIPSSSLSPTSSTPVIFDTAPTPTDDDAGALPATNPATDNDGEQSPLEAVSVDNNQSATEQATEVIVEEPATEVANNEPATPTEPTQPATPAQSPTSPTPIGLTALPDTPRSPAPNAADEPVPFTGPISTVTDYFVVRDGGSRIVEDYSSGWTQQDFNAGLPEPKITKPSHVNEADNPAPFFEGLANTTVFAGETLELLLRPKDSDQTNPGMFPELVPSNSQYVDNFNRTKTLRWTPLQPDVGIHEMKFTAVDEREPQYRAEYTVLVQVLLPDDQSGIENFPPGINGLRKHTVQVNDPVVIQIIGTDPNGTVPTIELLDRPPGSTLTQHPTEPNMSIMRFVPTNTGLITINAVAHDAIDWNKTGSTAFEIDVRPESDFQRDGPSLRDMATQRNLRIGYAQTRDVYHRPDGALYSRIAADEFNFITPENSLKWSYINPLPGRFRWASADNLVNYASVNGMEVHGHTLVWYSQIPNWIKFSAVEDREIFMREFIDRMLTRYGDRIPVWDVVNEAFEDDGSYRDSVWFEAMGADHIEIAFRQARASAPSAKLLYNDYDVAWDGAKSTAMFNMLQSLKDKNVPVDGVGFQLHVFAAFDQFDQVEANFQKAANMDLDIYVTELDVSMADGQTEAQQAEVYRRLLDICLRQERCKGFQSWGFTDQYSWRRQYNPLLLTDAYQPKPSYRALQQRLTEN